MSAVNPPFVIQASTHPSDVFRRMVKALAESTSGVIAPADMAVTAHGGTMSVDVAAGQAVVQGTENAITQGSYAVTNDAVVTLAIAAADPTNARNDLVVAKVQDATYSGATNSWSLVVVTGTPAGSPVDPAVPNNAIKLARVVVPANGTPVVAGWIADLRPFLYNSSNPIGTTGAAIGVPNAALGTYIGRWTTVGSPTAGTQPYSIGMFGFDGNGNLWVCTAAGSPGTWSPRGSHQLSLQSGAAGAGGYVFSSIPTGYRSLQLNISLRSTDAVNGLVNHLLRFNNDSTIASYRQQNQRTSGTATAAPSENIGSTTGINLTMQGGGVAAGFHSAAQVDIWNYASTATNFKVGHYRSVSPALMTGTGNLVEEYTGFVYQSAAATPITRIDIIPTSIGFDADSYALLLGIGF